ncbi:unnamed protein product [Diabrotica balteata]|uniref:Uncharacterized protein n=1 Tax=Diabrotica balteata TaxID=107213 RepID=A0A9N9SZC2_DIABA|nr:unnamed protein product [Diabrotica balteata]
MESVTEASWNTSISAVAQKVPSYLNLNDASAYTGLSLRRTSATLLIDGGGNLESLKRHGPGNQARSELLRQKQVPPTRAYVTLLSLYDTFNKESKRQGLSKYHGYPQKILKELADLSTSTSAYQLQYTLKKVVEHRDTSRSDIIKKVNQLVAHTNIVEIISKSHRIVYLIFKLNARYNLKVIQTYAPTTTHSDEEIEEFVRT